MLLERLVAEKGHAPFGVGDARAMESRKADPNVSQAKSESREKYWTTRIYFYLSHYNRGKKNVDASFSSSPIKI